MSSEGVWHSHVHPELLKLQKDICASSKQLHATSPRARHADSTTLCPEEEAGGLPLSRLYLAVHASNLLRNPTLSRALSRWPSGLVQQPWCFNAGESLAAYERPPQGVSRIDSSLRFPAPPAPYAAPAQGVLGRVAALLTPQQQAGEPGCLATGAQWVEVVQVVDLVGELAARGLTRQQAAAVLDRGLPLGFSVQVASHHAAAAGLAVCVMLDDGATPRASMQSFVARPTSHLFFSGYRRLPAGSGWRRFAHVVANVPVGCRRAMVMLRGRAAGALPQGVETHCGPRWASTELRLLTPHQAEHWGVNSSDQEAWPAW